MRQFLVLSSLAAAILSTGMTAQAYPQCPAMYAAAKALARVNGADFIGPSYRLPEVPRATDRGLEFNYSYDAMLNRGDAHPFKLGAIAVHALIPNHMQVCKVLELRYREASN
jgi:hypothetical protein